VITDSVDRDHPIRIDPDHAFRWILIIAEMTAPGGYRRQSSTEGNFEGHPPSRRSAASIKELLTQFMGGLCHSAPVAGPKTA
jgi:hypothetical protein